jgi:hypothetical protein
MVVVVVVAALFLMAAGVLALAVAADVVMVNIGVANADTARGNADLRVSNGETGNEQGEGKENRLHGTISLSSR